VPHSTHDHHDTPLTEANAVLAAPDESHVEHAETGLKAAAIPVAVGLIIGVIFVTVFLAAFHAPRPHDLPVAVIAETTADAGAAAGVQRALDGMAAGEFRVIGLPSRAAAETALQHREVFGVWLPGQATLLVAGANGPSVTGALTGPFTRLAGAATGARELSMVDTLPVSPNDTAGLSTFYAGFGVVLAGFLFAQISYAAGPVLPLRRRRDMQRRLLVLIDISGSMKQYTSGHMMLAHAIVQGAAGAEIFTIGTRLTRITRPLRIRQRDRALARVGELVEDWDGGTRIGPTLLTFLGIPRFAALARGAVIIIISDGLERGSHADMETALRRLSARAYRLSLCSPLVADPRFRPRTAALQAALPLLDDLVDGASLDSLTKFILTLARPAPSAIDIWRKVS